MNETIDIIPAGNDMNHCAKIMTGICAHTGEIAVMMTEIGNLKNSQTELKEDISSLNEQLGDFKDKLTASNNELSETLARVCEALKAEQEAKQGTTTNQRILLQEIKSVNGDLNSKLTAINKDIKSIDLNINGIQGDMRNVKEKVESHASKINTLERVSYWVYAGVFGIIMFAVAVIYWADIRSSMDQITNTTNNNNKEYPYFYENNQIFYLKDMDGDGINEKVLYTPISPDKK